MIQMAAHAKLNLYLDITGKRDDGYHTLDMLMQSIDLSDIVSIEEQESGISLETTDPCLPTDAQNLAFRAAELFLSAAHLESGIRIHIEKIFPLKRVSEAEVPMRLLYYPAAIFCSVARWAGNFCRNWLFVWVRTSPFPWSAAAAAQKG